MSLFTLLKGDGIESVFDPSESPLPAEYHLMRSLTKTLLIVGVITAVVSGMGLSSAQAGGFRYLLNYGASCYTPRFCTTSYYTQGQAIHP